MFSLPIAVVLGILLAAHLLFALPLSHAFWQGLQAARDPNARVTPASPEVFFRRRFRRAIRWWRWVWLLVFAGTFLAVYCFLSLNYSACWSASFGSLPGIGLSCSLGNIPPRDGPVPEHDDSVEVMGRWISRKTVTPLLCAIETACVVFALWNLVGVACRMAAPWLRRAALLGGLAMAAPILVYGLIVLGILGLRHWGLVPELFLETSVSYQLFSTQFPCAVPLIVFPSAVISLALNFAACLWRRRIPTERWFRLDRP
ncbi:MAG: hypothetical protein NTW86_11110 [Candidatus Sumerlaeota bacterium]|nr:hypothetical protein [Candidatus Sumerlaeota bacterium]